MDKARKQIIAIVTIGVIAILAVLIVVTVLVTKHFKNNNTAEETTTMPNYAVNETTSTETVVDYEIAPEHSDFEVVAPTDTSETTAPTEYDFVQNENFQEDVNFRDERLSYDTISICGNVITFPALYEDVSLAFSPFCTEQSNRYEVWYEPFDMTSVNTNFTVYSEQGNGVGRIAFYFVSPNGEATTIDNMICYKVSLSILDVSEETLMSIALRGGINFGASTAEIVEAYGNPKTRVEDDLTHYFQYTYDLTQSESVLDEETGDYVISNSTVSYHAVFSGHYETLTTVVLEWEY